MASAFRRPGQVSATRSRAGYQKHEPPGVVLHRARLSSGIPLTKAALVLRISPASLALIESGGNCHWNTLASYAKFLGVSLEIDLPRARLANATVTLIAQACGLGETTTRDVLFWLLAAHRDDNSGLHLESVEKFLAAFNCRVEVA